MSKKPIIWGLGISNILIAVFVMIQFGTIFGILDFARIKGMLVGFPSLTIGQDLNLNPRLIFANLPYRNMTYGFKMKYPDNYYGVSENDFSPASPGQAKKRVSVGPTSAPSVVNGIILPRLEIVFSDPSAAFTLQEYRDKAYGDKILPNSEITIGKNKHVIYMDSDKTHFRTLLENNGVVFDISSSSEGFLRRTLKTFEFLVLVVWENPIPGSYAIQYPKGTSYHQGNIPPYGHAPFCRVNINKNDNYQINSDCYSLPNYFPGTDLVGTGIAVRQTSTFKDELSCLNFKDMFQFDDYNSAQARETALSQKNIGGVKFSVLAYEGVAAGSQTFGSFYRAFRRGVCYEIIDKVDTSSRSANGYPPGTKPFTADQEEKARDVLDQTLASFRFND